MCVCVCTYSIPTSSYVIVIILCNSLPLLDVPALKSVLVNIRVTISVSFYFPDWMEYGLLLCFLTDRKLMALIFHSIQPVCTCWLKNLGHQYSKLLLINTIFFLSFFISTPIVCFGFLLHLLGDYLSSHSFLTSSFSISVYSLSWNIIVAFGMLRRVVTSFFFNLCLF